jgi:alginate O-acetyltransferase complex protein AlgI
MALGVSLWFNLPATRNFRQPYSASSVSEFWTRWHISLSTWFREYLYFPLSRNLIRRFGSKYNFSIQTVALFITMLATGIWHGSNLTFVIWGALHGLFILLERVLDRRSTHFSDEIGSQRAKRIRRFGNIAVTQCLIFLGWVFFKADSVYQALLFLSRLFSPMDSVSFGWWIKLLTPLVLIVLVDGLQTRIVPNGIEQIWQLPLQWRVVILCSMILILFILGGASHATFVYAAF